MWSVALASGPDERVSELHAIFRPTEVQLQAALAEGRQLAREGKSWQRHEARWWKAVGGTTLKGFRGTVACRVLWTPPSLMAQSIGYRAEKLRVPDSDVEDAMRGVRSACAPENPRASFVVEVRHPDRPRSRAQVQPLGYVLAIGGREYPAAEVLVADQDTQRWVKKGSETVYGWGQVGQGQEQRYNWWGVQPTTEKRTRVVTQYTVLVDLRDKDGTARVPVSAAELVLKIVFETQERTARFELAAPTE
jgi:hypothetical protein